MRKKHKLHVILTGPSRGFVIQKLKKMKVSYEHHLLNNYHDIKKYYSIINVYLVTSREEGGPRSILESMASGALIYSTKVGQAKELIKNGINGHLYEINNCEKICKIITKNYLDTNKTNRIIKNARSTAMKFSHNKMKKNWIEFFEKLKKN